MTTWAVHRQHTLSERLWRQSGEDREIERVRKDQETRGIG